MKEANELFKNHIINDDPLGYLKIQIRPYHTPNVDNLFVIEPFIDQTFGNYDEFKKFLYEQPETIDVLELKTFYKKFELNKFNPVKFERNTIEIYSNENCIFINSEKHPSIPKNKNVITFEHPWQIEIIKQYPEFQFANWIADKFPMDEDEATAGGDYLIEYKLNLAEDIMKVESANIKLFVDDYCDFSLNANILKKKISTGGDRIYIKKNLPITHGHNVFQFKIKNNSALENGSPTTTGIENPYGIIFVIELKFKTN